MVTKTFFPRSLFVSISFFVFCVLVAAGTAAATTYYVASTGNDANPGSQVAPFKTIQKAANLVNPGDTVIVANGTYTYTSGNVLVNLTRSGTAANPITFRSATKYGAKLNGNSGGVFNQGAHSLFFLSNVSYIVIDGFEMYDSWGAGVANTGSTSYLSRGVIIKNNYIRNIGNYISNTDAGMGGILPKISSDAWVIDSNIFYEIGRVYNPDRPQGDWRDHHIYGVGINHQITNNVFDSGAHRAGFLIQISSEYSNPFKSGSYNLYGWTITNNTFVGHETNNPGVSQIRVNYPAQTANMIVANNIFYDVGTGGVGTVGIYWGGSGQNAGPGWYIRNNICSGTLEKGDNNYLPTVPVRTNNVSNTDPKFINAAGRDYHLQSSSPAIGFANAADLPNHDFDQIARPQGAGGDAGAYEYQESTAAGPVAYYLMDAGSGQVATDNSGKGNNAVLGNTTASEANDPTWTSGMNGYALLFNGSNNVVTIPHSASLDGLKKFTVSAWINPTANSGSPRIISKESANGDDFYWCVSPATGYMGVAVVDATGREIISSISNAIQPNQWNHVVMTFDDSADRKCHLYVNSFEFSYIRQDTLTGTLKTSPNNWKIGNLVAGNRPFDGRIDSLRIYNRALSPSEIANLYNEERF